LSRQVEKRLSALPGVKSVGATNFLPLSGFWGTTSFLLRGQAPPKEGQAPEADNRVSLPAISHDGLPVAARAQLYRCGPRRWTASGDDQPDHGKAVFRDKDPVGEELNLGSSDKPDWWQIVGVTGDVKAFGQDQPTHADIYRPFDQLPFPLVAFTCVQKPILPRW
jgi:hypothetical protein